MSRDRNSERANLSLDVRMLHAERDVDELERFVYDLKDRTERSLLELKAAFDKRVEDLDHDIAQNRQQVSRLFSIALGLIATVAASTVSLLVGRIGS